MSLAIRQAVPDLVPARMLNEFAYCPRLFYLEWVEGLWEENADTAEGELAHARSDRGGGRLPPPDETDDDGWAGKARAVTLDAPELGVIAKIDLIESEDGSVSPIDFKKGRPRPDGRPWEPELLQMAAQILVLRANGYRCERGFISFRETRTRVAVEVDEALEREVRSRLRELRATAARAEAPAPLVASPKCPRCSLVGICLPDELNALQASRETPRPRRLIAMRPDSAPLYVQEAGAVVRLSRGRIEVSKGRETLASLRRIDVSEVALFGPASISAPALRELAASGIPVTHFSYGGRFQALTVGLEPNNIELRIAQFRTADDQEASLRLARRFVAGKIRNQRVLIRRNGGESVADAVRELLRLARRAERAPDLGSLLGIEGAAAREYFRSLGRLVEPGSAGEFEFQRRSRRPPRDRPNAILSFLYALLVKECALACRRVGFDPLLGFFHRPRFGRPALALDLMEECRPLLADSVLLTLINGRRLTRGDFLVRAGTVTLTASGRRAVIAAFERRMTTESIHPTFRYRVVYRRALELQARILAAALLGEVPEYRPLVTR
jgi:CRISPR-associated protein Cas1